MTAIITPSSATGRVTFYDGVAVLGDSAISGGRAVFTTRLSSSAIRLLRAYYAGDAADSPANAVVLSAAATNIDADSASSRGPSPASQRVSPRLSGGPPLPSLISTIAGIPVPATSLPGTSAVIGAPAAVATDAAGNVFFSSNTLNAVFRLDLSGTLTRVAGTGTAGYSGDYGPAVDAELYGPNGVAADTFGNVYIVDAANARVRMVSASGIITTVAGGGCCSLGDNGPATSAQLMEPSGVAVDASGNLFITELGAGRVRKVDKNGTITTVAGTGAAGYSGDNGQATSAQLYFPNGLAVDASGNIFIADTINNRVRKVSPNGVITTIAGTGAVPESGDNGPATSANLEGPQGVALDAAGRLYIADTRSIRMVSNGIISTVAGSQSIGYGGDGGPAIGAVLALISGVAVDQSGNVFIADSRNQRIREVSAGQIATAAGGAPGDGNPLFAMFLMPQSIAKDGAGNIYVCDTLTHRVHKITPAGVISTVAGTGVPGYSGDTGPATAAQLNQPWGIAVDSSGNLYVADTSNSRIRRVTPGGTITTVAGTGNGSYSGDGALAVNAQIAGPFGVAVDSSGDLFIADTGNNRVRKVNAAGIISTVAGNGFAGYSGDSGPGTAAKLNSPSAVAADASGNNLYIIDSGNNRIRKVDANGVITTFAGNGSYGYSGDGNAATGAQLNGPYGVAVDASGVLYVADTGNECIRTINAAGVIATIAGDGARDYFGDGGPALNAAFSTPTGVSVDPSGNVSVADANNRVVRLLTAEGGAAVLTVSSTHSGSFPLGGTGQYTLTVSNAALAGPTNGTVTVTELVPDGLSVLSITGTGWYCGNNSCTRSDTLASGTSYPIEVAVSVLPTAPSQITNAVTVSAGNAAMTGGLDLTQVTSSPITIQTNPTGLQFRVDGLSAQTAPQTLSLSPGSHTIDVPSPQAGVPGSRYVFASWSDGLAQTHSITVNGAVTTYTATLTTQYQLTTAAFPLPGGTVTPATGSYYDAGSSVTISAIPAAPYTLSSWSGALSGAANPTSITMNEAQSVTANFSVPGFTCTVSGDLNASVSDVQVMINEALGAVLARHDLNRDGAVNVADIQKVINAVLGMGCLY